jgi:predicted nucleic acid-binding protein
MLSRTGAPARLVELWLAGAFDLVVCGMLLDEVTRTLAQPKIRKRVAPADAARFVRLFRELAEVVDDPDGDPPVRSADPADDYLLALAAREHALLVSGDAHVLELAVRLPISTPHEFLDELERNHPSA